MAILIQNKGLSGRFKISGNTTGGFKARYVGVDTDAQAFFSRVTAAGGTLSATEQSAIIQLVSDLKSAGIWTLMKTMYPMVGASAAACAQNLKSSSFTGTFNGGWTYTSLGVTSNGSNAFFNTNFLNQGDWTSTSNGSMGFISRTNQGAGSPCDMGSGTISTGGDSSTIYANFAGNFYGGINCTIVTPGSPNGDTVGFFATSRISSAGYSIYKRGSSIINVTTTNAIGSNPNNNIYLGAGNNAGTASGFSTKQFNFCFIGDGLTQAQIDTYYNILLTFNNSLSR